MNKIFLSGNLTRDPEMRYTNESSVSYAKMGIAVQRRVSKNANSDKPTVDFFNMTAWGKTAEFCSRYLKKGSKVLVEGRLNTSSYEGKDGVKRNSVDIWIENIEFASSKSSDGGNSDYNYNKNNSLKESKDDFGGEFAGEDISDDDVPF